jgi:hypothetical protein
MAVAVNAPLGHGVCAKLQGFWSQSSDTINKYVILPISESNSFRNQVIIVTEIALAIIFCCAFSATVHLTIKTKSILGRGLGMITAVGFIDMISICIADIFKRLFFTQPSLKTPEELYEKKLKNLTKEKFYEEFERLTGYKLGVLYSKEIQKKIAEQTETTPFYQGLVPILVRFACLKNQLEKKESSLKRFILGKKPTKAEKALMQELISQRTLDIMKIKLELALALMIVIDPFIDIDQGLEQIGYFNEVVFSCKACDFLKTDTPYFLSKNVDDQNELQRHQYITFKSLQSQTIKTLAKQLKNIKKDARAQLLA